MQFLRFTALSVLFLLLAMPTAAEPEIFSTNSFEQDRSTATEADKLHVIYFTATWCPPCQKMKKTTWVDESLVSWLEENAVVSAVDVDEEPEISKSYRVRAMPTMVVVRHDEELARTVGYQSAVGFKDWLERAEAGLIASPATAFTLPEGVEAVDVREKLDEAGELVQGGSLDEATKAYVWLWDNMLLHDESFIGVRGSFMAADMHRLADEHEPAKKAFQRLRDREEASLKNGDVTWDRLDDWIVLNEVIGDEDATLAWVERNVVERGNTNAIGRLEFRVHPLLIERGRYDILAMVTDPSLEVDRAIESMKMTDLMLRSRGDENVDERMQAEMEKSLLRRFRKEASVWFGVALASDNRETAAKIAKKALDQDPSSEMREALTMSAENVGAAMIELPE